MLKLITKKQALTWTRGLWRWKQKNPGKPDRLWPGWKRIRSCANDCPLCEYDDEHFVDTDCDGRCLLGVIWPEGCAHDGTPWDLWLTAMSKPLKQKYAKMIADAADKELKKL